MRIGLKVVIVITTLIALVACGGNKVDDATAEKYIAKAEEIVALFNKGAYGEIHVMFDEQMKTGLPEDEMEELAPIIEGSGDFEDIDKASVEELDGYYVVVLVANYSEEDRVFTISFNDQEEVAGLYMK